MPEAKRMVAGFNHNVKHRGKVYHVQTEDSGLQNPHIITHLFVGGNILASRKTSYADIVGAENLAQVVRELMEEQHKEMLRNLVNGVYDDIHEEHVERVQHWQPGELAAGPAPAAGPEPAPPAAPAETPPAAARASPAPPPAGVVGAGLVSERSLDEVILSYLAEDLGEKK